MERPADGPEPLHTDDGQCGHRLEGHEPVGEDPHGAERLAQWPVAVVIVHCKAGHHDDADKKVRDGQIKNEGVKGRAELGKTQKGVDREAVPENGDENRGGQQNENGNDFAGRRRGVRRGCSGIECAGVVSMKFRENSTGVRHIFSLAERRATFPPVFQKNNGKRAFRNSNE